MKKILLLALLLPSVSFAQRFELSEQAGVSLYTLDFIPGTQKAFTNHISGGYHVSKLLSLSAFYEYEAWKAANNAYGATADLNFKHFFVGADLAAASMQPMGNIDGIYIEHYGRSYGFGAYVGTKQRLLKDLSLVEQVGINVLYLNVSSYSIQEGIIYGGPILVSRQPPYTQRELMPYCRIGLSYRF